MNAPTVVIACPCGGHSLTLPADKLPVGGRAAFVCPICRVRRSVVRTRAGVEIDGQPTAGLAGDAPLAGKPSPSPAPPTARIALALIADAGWREALAAALPPGWHVLAPETAAQAVADFLAHAPGLVLADDSAPARAVAATIAALPGSHRERLILLALVPAPEADPLTTFACSADAVLDSRDTADLAERLRAAFDRAASLPSLFTEGRG